MIAVGKFGAPHGVQGWVKLYSHTQPFHHILNYSPWYIKKNSQWTELEISDCKPQGEHFLVRIQDVCDRDAAAEWTHQEVMVNRDQLPECDNNEYYWSDLVECAVVNLQDHAFGRVTHLLETGANDVLVIKGDAGETLIPFVMERFIISVDLSLKRITVDWDQDLE